MLKAIIFDFNGIIADDEPIHFELFARVMSEEGITIPREEYNRLYLHLNDRDAFQTALAMNRRPVLPGHISKLIQKKSNYYNKLISNRDILFPDAADFIKSTAAHYPLAIASGALNEEIAFILGRGGLMEHFPIIIGAEKAVQGKPHPECYLKALSGLNDFLRKIPPMKASEVLVIEDSVGGIEGAHRAGMVCLAITNSYPRQELLKADYIFDSLSEIDLKQVQKGFEK